MLASWILCGDALLEPYHYSFKPGMQISYKKKAKYHEKLYKKQWMLFFKKILRTC